MQHLVANLCIKLNFSIFTLLGRCNQRSYSPYLNPYDYGFGHHTQKKFPIGKLYLSLYSTIDNKDQFEVSKINLKNLSLYTLKVFIFLKKSIHISNVDRDYKTVIINS